MASVVPLCCLCGKKASCTFLNENPLFFGLRNVLSAFFPQRRHRGTTEAIEATEEKTQCVFPERSQRRRFFFADGQKGENAMPFLREVTKVAVFFDDVSVASVSPVWRMSTLYFT